MKIIDLLILNQGNIDRGVRLVVAAVLLLLAYSFENLASIDYVFIFVSLTLIFNALSGNCYIYRALGINTCPVSKNE